MTGEETLKEKIESTNADVATELIHSSQGHDINSEQTNQINELIRDLNASHDPLYQVNCLQIVGDMASDKKTLELLETKGVPQKIIALLNQNDPLIIPHALKIFYKVNPLDLELKYPQVLDKLCEYCQSESNQLIDYAIDLIAAIGRGGFLARKVLDRHPKFIHKCLPQIGSTIISSDTLLKSRTLGCIKDLLEFYNGDPREETSALSESFYHGILSGEMRMTNQLLALCRIPIMEIRISALEVVGVVAEFSWAQKELTKHSDFNKWIIDRSSEACKEGKESKFKILEAIVKSKTGASIFGGKLFMDFRADWKNGPFHVGIAEEMMTDNQQANT